MDGSVAGAARILDPVAQLGLHAGRILKFAFGGHDVYASGQNFRDLIVIAVIGHIQDAVRPQRQDRGGIVGRRHAHRRMAAQGAGILTGLGGGVDIDAHKLHRRVFDHRPQRA